MGILESLAWYIVQKILTYLLGKAESAIKDYEDQKAKDATNAANAKAYEDAKDRKDKINAATNLLNGVSPP